MKTILTLILLFSLLATGCRKGEDDPFLSLKSRNKRLCGKWKVVESVEKYQIGSSINDYEEYVFNFSSPAVEVFLGGVPITSYSYSEEWEFFSDGKYTHCASEPNFSMSEEGFWNWNGKDKNSDFKKKECVYLTGNKYNYNNGETVDEYSGRTQQPSKVIILKRLTAKELVFECEFSINIIGTDYARYEATIKLNKI
jgi:hypothetical protein